MYQCYIHANLFEICQPVHEIWCPRAFLGLKFDSLSPAVTLKIRSSSPKPNQLFIMSQCYIHANLIKIHPSVHELSCKQESVTLTPMLIPTPTGSAPKTICPPSLSVGDIIYDEVFSTQNLVPNMKFSLHQRPPRYSRNISTKLCIDISKIKPKRSVISIFHQNMT